MGFSKNPLLDPKIQDGWDTPPWKSTWRHFFCRGWSDLDKILQTGAERHVDCSDMVKIETRSRIPIWRMFGRIPWHPRATCHIAGCCHLANSTSWSQSYAIFYYFMFLFYCSLGFDDRRLSYPSATLVLMTSCRTETETVSRMEKAEPFDCCCSHQSVASSSLCLYCVRAHGGYFEHIIIYQCVCVNAE